MIIHFGHSCLTTNNVQVADSETKQILHVLPVNTSADTLEKIGVIKDMMLAEIEGRINLYVGDLEYLEVALEVFRDEERVGVGMPDSAKATTIPADFD